MQKELEIRSENKCEFCQSENGLKPFAILPATNNVLEDFVVTCEECTKELSLEIAPNPDKWKNLSDLIWHEADAVKIAMYRILNALKSNTWAQEQLDIIYLDDNLLERAKEGLPIVNDVEHLDCNGVLIQSGDTVTLIKDLKVKGGGFTAKRGTAVRNIKLVQNDPSLIEGKVDGQVIYLLTEFVKK